MFNFMLNIFDIYFELENICTSFDLTQGKRNRTAEIFPQLKS